MKRSDPQSIRQIIDTVLDTSSVKSSVLEHRASYLWPNIVGPGINRLTTRRYVAKGVLHVYISSAAVKSELTFTRENIRKAINDALGSEVITEIKIH
jgi:predicted nucleic acid-binding Zn ribbon protein